MVSNVERCDYCFVEVVAGDLHTIGSDQWGFDHVCDECNEKHGWEVQVVSLRATEFATRGDWERFVSQINNGWVGHIKWGSDEQV